jgi:acetate kinase
VRVLVLNAGSSSLKTSLVEGDRAITRDGRPWSTGSDGRVDRLSTVRAALAGVGLGDQASRPPDAVAHRVVHGGSRFDRPVRIDEDVIAAIAALEDLAPLHTRGAIETMQASRPLLSASVHVACFDTAFHAGLPASARRYPLPETLTEDHDLRRYGFHGLSVEWAVGRAAELLGDPTVKLALVVAHLGSGCSVTATEGGRSMRTSMGLTPLEGLMMGTRAGSVDPGLLLHILRRGFADISSLGDALEHRSGLLGVSGRSADVRDLEAAAAAGDARSDLALTMFVERAAEGIAAAATGLDRLDAVVFTGGIGENAGRLRARIVDRLTVLGLAPIRADETGEDRVLPTTAARSPRQAGRPRALRIEAREDLVAARAAGALAARPHGSA